MKCKKCQGLMIQEEVKDFYVHVEFMRCINCGETHDLYKKEYSIREEVLNAR